MKTDGRERFRKWVLRILLSVFLCVLGGSIQAQLTVTEEAQQQLQAAADKESLEKNATTREFKLATARRLLTERKVLQDQIAAINQRLADIARQLGELNQ